MLIELSVASSLAAVKHVRDAAKDDTHYDEVWVVYDHDDFGADHLNRAAEAIRALNEHASANPCTQVYLLVQALIAEIR